MAIPPSAETCVDDVCKPAAVLRDEVAEHRVRRTQAAQRRQCVAGHPELTEPEREEYELRLDAYEVELAECRERLEEYATLLNVALGIADRRRDGAPLPRLRT